MLTLEKMYRLIRKTGHKKEQSINRQPIPEVINIKQANLADIKDADLINIALFGRTAKEWSALNQNNKTNIREQATIEQLVVLRNIESINALLIEKGQSKAERLSELNKVAITQMKSLLIDRKLKKQN